MHFYTYDEWAANAYYSIDAREIGVGARRVVNLSEVSNTPYLNILSCWSDPQFISTYTAGTPSIVPEMSKIDCDVGCLYKMKYYKYGDTADRNYAVGEYCSHYDSATYQTRYYRCISTVNSGDSWNSSKWTEVSRSRMHGCLQPLGSASATTGDTEKYPFIQVNSTTKHDRFDQINYDALSINLQEYAELDQILIFQSIYSGAISFQEMSSYLEFRFQNMLDNCYLKSDGKVEANRRYATTCKIDVHTQRNQTLQVTHGRSIDSNHLINILQYNQSGSVISSATVTVSRTATSTSVTISPTAYYLRFSFNRSYIATVNTTRPYKASKSYLPDDYTYKILTNYHSDTSLMIAAALLTFDTSGGTNYLTIDNICKFVYGHVDMDQQFDWNLLWKTFVPPENAAILDSSIMHYTKEAV